MPRPVLDESALHPAIRQSVAELHADLIAEVQAAVLRHPVVVVGMAQNPFVKRARKALEQAGHPFTYLEYGSYLGEWKKRLALMRCSSGSGAWCLPSFHRKSISEWTERSASVASKASRMVPMKSSAAPTMPNTTGIH